MKNQRIIKETNVLCVKAYKAVKTAFPDSLFDKQFDEDSIPEILEFINHASVLVCEAKTKYLIFNDSFEKIETELEAYFNTFDKFVDYIFNDLAVTKSREHICDTLDEFDESYQTLKEALHAISPDLNVR